MGLLSPAAACDGGSRSRSRARRPCGGSPCTSRRSSSPKHGPSRLPPADENAPKITFLPSRTPYRGSHRRGQPGTKGARLITASPQYVKLAPGSAGDPTHDLSASNSRTAFDLDPPARFRAGEGRGPHLHRLRQQARPGIDQRLAWLQQDLGTGADTAVFGTVFARRQRRRSGWGRNHHSSARPGRRSSPWSPWRRGPTGPSEARPPRWLRLAAWSCARSRSPRHPQASKRPRPRRPRTPCPRPSRRGAANPAARIGGTHRRPGIRRCRCSTTRQGRRN